MGEPKLSISPHGLSGRIGADAAPIAADLRRLADLDDKLAGPTRDRSEPSPADPPHESLLIVYCDDPQQVSEGFAIALRAMAVATNLLQVDIAPPIAGSNR